MENISKPKEMSSDKTRKIFGIIRKKENFQNHVKEASSTFSTSVTKALSDYGRQAELIRDKMTMQSRCLTRLL